MLALYLATAHVNCQTSIPDSMEYEIIPVDTQLALSVTMYYSDDFGGTSLVSGTSHPMDSFEFSNYLSKIENSGGSIGEAQVFGKKQLFRQVQRMFAVQAISDESEQLESAYLSITGNELSHRGSSYDNGIIGYWLLIDKSQSPKVTSPIEFKFNGTGKLVAKDSTKQRLSYMLSANILELGPVGSLPKTLILFRKKEGTLRFLSVSGDYALRPDYARIREEKNAGR